MPELPGFVAASLDALLRPVLATTLRVAVKPVLSPAVPYRLQRGWSSAALQLSTLVPRDVTATAEYLGAVPAERLRGPGVRGDVAAIYLHGGAFCIGAPRSHRVIGARLARVLRAPVYVPEYRLAPEHPFPAALDDALASYDAVRARGYASEAIAIVGDSAGGGLALALLGALRARGSAMPAVAVLFSPWVDLTLSGATIAVNAASDPLVSPAWLDACARVYRGSVAAADPRVSPLFGSFEGFPPLALHVGTREVLLDDAARLDVRARAGGVDVDYRRYDGLWHNSQVQAGVLSSAQASYDDAAAFVNRFWPQSTAS